jgi:hypothetical protein
MLLQSSRIALAKVNASDGVAEWIDRMHEAK